MVRNVFLATMLALALAVCWRLSAAGRFDGFLNPKRETPRPIVFDNGTVRTTEAASQAGSGDVERSAAIGSARKCKSGDKVTYTDLPCPKGAKEHAIGGTMTVLEGPLVPKPPKAAPDAPPGKRQGGLLESLDTSGNQNLHDKRIERAVNQ